MARSGAVWAIDIGQCALKALRCRAHAESGRLVAEAFDYIEYPKILSQPGADSVELVNDALKVFLSRNTVKGDRVAISVSGQSGLARFIKLPPVEAKKIPDIVRYEARQQIPFDLNDVIWDYQRMGGGAEEEGFALETEVGLFAMKRDAVFRALEPFRKVGIEVDIVQLAPLALYNFLLFDQLTDLPPADEYDPDDPPESVVVISLGTDATDLVVTNGYRVWQRSIPLGGNHFTKALTKELKLTFAKAEHLKRNAASAQDSKAVFQAMRPVFRDLLTELQRSIGYFRNLDRSAKIRHVVAMGNTMKLPGLRKYLSQSLDLDVHRLDEFRGLSGPQVVGAPAFKDNVLGFGVCYGLALQGLGMGGLRTNLLPKEILKDRLIRQKKPWAVAAAAAILLACGISFGAYSRSLSRVEPTSAVGGVTWQSAESQANSVQSQSSGLQSDKDAALAEFQAIDAIGRNLTGNVEGRLRWLELWRALAACLPPYVSDAPAAEEAKAATQEVGLKTADELAQEIAERGDLYVTGLQCQYFPDMAMWYQSVQTMGPVWPEGAGESKPSDAAVDPAAADPTAVESDLGAEPAALATGPSGPGWAIRLTGYHFHNFQDPKRVQGATYVLETLLAHLNSATMKLPNADRTGADDVSTKDLGISCPVLVNPGRTQPVTEANPFAAAGAGLDAAVAAPLRLSRFDFEVQFCWQPKTPTEREATQDQFQGEQDLSDEAPQVP